MPVPYNPERGQEAAALFSQMPRSFQDLVAGTAGCSPYLAGLLAQESDWITRIEVEGAEALRSDVLTRDIASNDIAGHLRQGKRRVALLAALADLGGVWSLEQVTGTLTDYADLAVDLGLKHLLRAEIGRGKLPMLTEDDIETAGGMCVLAMGKMGAGELNYSSDIDLICLFDETRFDPDDYQDARAGFVRITRRLMSLISENTKDGYVFRTDLRLRPDASVTPVCIAMEAAERYYESVGRNWERAAYIKARPCAGDIAAGGAFLERLTPFIWRRHLDFAAIEDTHDMRTRIRDHKRLHSDAIEGHNVKLGRGGIREIEFFTQTRQLIAGGRDANLRSRETVTALGQLARAGWVEDDIAQRLSKQYRAWRAVEHRLQMIGDAQTHDLPKSDEDFARLACFMGETNSKVLKMSLAERIADVVELTDSFYAPIEAEAKPSQADIQTYLEKWRGFAALRSPRAVSIFRRLFPNILERLNSGTDPDAALSAFERFLAGLPAGVQVFSLFESNPGLVDLFVDICTASPELAEYLSRNAQVLDAVIAGDFFAPWPGVENLRHELVKMMGQADSYEARLDLARRWQKEWHFRVSVHFLRGIIPAEEASTQYADLAQAVVAALFPVVTQEFARKHGEQPGRGAAVLAMGSLGAGRLTSRSDLDLIVIYDAQDVDASDGPRPLGIRPYFARLTQALITSLSAPTSEGKLYDVDMRLRPSGQSGPVATSLQSFTAYQKTEAWVWEHLALTRARPIAGDASLCGDVDAVRREVLRQEQSRKKVFTELSEMRVRLVAARPGKEDWSVKDGSGGSQDVELFAQSVALLSGALAYDVSAQLDAGVAAGILSADQVDDLSKAYRLMRNLQISARLLTDGTLDPDQMSSGGQDVLLRETGAPDLPSLQQQVAKCRKQAKKVINSALRG